MADNGKANSLEASMAKAKAGRSATEIALRAVALAGTIGYGEGDLATTLRAFQRHWLPGAISGQADTATRARLHAVAMACAQHHSAERVLGESGALLHAQQEK